MAIGADWVGALASCVGAGAVVAAFWQLRESRRISQTGLEDALSKEYRDLVGEIPVEAFLGLDLEGSGHNSALDSFYRYFDLCNMQVHLRRQGRIGQSTWCEWSEGICDNLRLPAFASAWDIVKSESDSFDELRLLEAEGFCSDPGAWA